MLFFKLSFLIFTIRIQWWKRGEKATITSSYKGQLPQILSRALLTQAEVCSRSNHVAPFQAGMLSLPGADHDVAQAAFYKT